ncbi:hypothetical protein Glove_21g47 [Diversispora epigaea]|uniref:Uncharacterized protein n=1 Tax=Diversispora epigaea TaxID=1348612 RepID=A0A397JLR3_9GLOM|nr:hypothetical protein Glove_21g47 [Diversispora epigaea]
MANTQSTIDLLRELNAKLVADIAELRKENSDKEKTDLIAKLDDDIKEIKQDQIGVKLQNLTHSCQTPDSSSDYSGLQVTSLPIGDYSDKEILSHYEINDSVTTNITPVTPEQIENISAHLILISKN